METRKWSSYGARMAKSLSFPIPVSQSSVCPSTLSTKSVDRSVQTAGLLKKEGKHHRSLRQMGSALPKPERAVGKLDCREVFRRNRRPGPDFPGEPRSKRHRVPEVHYPVTLCSSRRAGSAVISPEAL